MTDRTLDAGGAARPALATFLLCLAVALVEGFDLQTAGVAGPRVGAEFHLSPAELGWFFTSSTLGLFLGAAFGGRLADRLGRKRVLIGSIAVFGACSLATGLAQSYAALVAARLVTGIGLGGAMPNAIALTAEAGAERSRATRVSLMTAVMPIGGALCAAYGVANPDADWRTFFLIGGWAPLALAAALSFLLPESAAFTAAKAEKATAGVGDALFGEGRARTTLLLWTAFLTTFAIAYVFINWLPSLMVAKGYARPQAAAAAMLYNLFGSAGGVVFGLLLERLGRRATFACVYACIGGAALLLANTPDVFALALAAASVLGFFVNAGQFLLYGVAPTYYPARGRCTGVGAAVAAARIGAFGGPLLAAGLLGGGAGPSAVLLAILPLTGLALAAAVAMVWRGTTSAA